MQKIILVNKENKEIGFEEKLRVHQKGLLHRAFSIFVFNDQKELLLQQRSKNKYHSGGLWSNTVCSHPRMGESYQEATHRRLKEEMGFDCPLERVGSFIYRVEFKDGLIEHEHDTIFVGSYNRIVKPNPDEVMDYCWKKINIIKKDIQNNPDIYSFWFKVALKKINYFKKI